MVDPARLSARLAQLRQMGGPPFVQKMIALFVEHTPPRLAGIRQGLAQGDLAAVEFAAHSLKSSAGNLGADRVQELAQEIESLAAARQGDTLPTLAVELGTELDAVIAWLKQQVQESEA
ncbi:MAG: Hpt domain-containing protein [Planctomycetia bacterium]|nr:Hpt domain-containing protein [Planctomycetia bacterium]